MLLVTGYVFYNAVELLPAIFLVAGYMGQLLNYRTRRDTIKRFMQLALELFSYLMTTTRTHRV